MKPILFLYALIVFVTVVKSFSHQKAPLDVIGDHPVLSTVKIYSNLAEIIQPLGKLPLEFSAEDWSDIRSDSITLVGTNVTVTQQTITEKKKSLNNVQVYVRSPSSSEKETKFISATIVDEKRNLVKLIDKDISKDPIFLTVSFDRIIYNDEPPQSKYYVNFTYDKSDAVSVSYLRSNLNWKTSYQLNLFEDPKNPVLIAMADIRNDGQSKIDIQHAELIGGDINLQMNQKSQWQNDQEMDSVNSYQKLNRVQSFQTPVPTITEGEEVAGLYIFPIKQAFSIDAKTDYLLPMFRPQVKVDRYASISKYFYGSAGSTTGKAQRSYRLSSDRFLSRGKCIIRESDRLVGETSLPDLAAKNKHEFSIGQDVDIVYKENSTLFTSYTYNITTSSNRIQSQTKSTYDISLLLKNFKKNRPVKIEYEQFVHGKSIKLITSNTEFSQVVSTIKYQTTIPANNEILLSYKVEIIN